MNKKRWAVFVLLAWPAASYVVDFYMKLIVSLSYKADDLLYNLTGGWSPLEWLGVF